MTKIRTSRRSATTLAATSTAAALAALALSTAPPATAAPPAAGPLQIWVVDPATSAIKNLPTGGCLTVAGPDRPTTLQACNGGGAQRLTVQGTTITDLYRFCLTGTGPSNPTILRTCDRTTGQQFAVSAATRTIRNIASGLCLTATRPNSPTVMQTCTP